MSRTGMIRVCVVVSLLTGPVGMAMAAGPGSFAGAPRYAPQPSAAIQHRAAGNHWVRHDGARQHGERRWSGHGRRLFTSAGYLGPWTYSFGPGSSYAAPAESEGPRRWIDRNSFENLPARTGIARAPTPEPTLYRIEGRRDRPVTRVIRIGEPEPRQGRRSRFAHAETGALLLTVPGR